MASSPLQLRHTVFKVVSDPDSFKAGISQTLNLSSGFSRSRAPPVIGIDDPGLVEPDEAVDNFALQDVIDQRKLNMPHRLICTEDGRLYDQSAVEARFRAEHASFFDPTAVSSDVETMLDAVKTSFAYVMFSYRWEVGEPLYQDLNGSDVFSLAECHGTRKVQQFCRYARERGFRWAWSGTCCTDKTVSAVQTSITSLFKWYRNSDLTIVYLDDVCDNSIQALRESAWFLRGFTLQELLAPHRLVFFQSDWTLLVTSPDLPINNYKASPTFRRLMTEITGIDDDTLTNFDPTSHHITIRQRMSWAAHRKTAAIEDMAYCLMGIFNVNIPVMYGEGEKAFHRLQVEIMTVWDDPSLFDWTGKPGMNSFLASSPACFEPLAPVTVNPVPAMLRVTNALKKKPLVQKDQRSVDSRNINFSDMQEHLNVNVQNPVNYMAGAMIHCHGLEYSVLNVEETKVMSDACKAGNEGRLFQYHITAESLHPITVTLVEPINTGIRPGWIQSKYLSIFRVWDQSLATGQSVEDDWNHPLRQPFVAHLLASEPGGMYRRIQVKDRIVAKLDQLAEVRLPLQLRTLVTK